jgi:hypothetical protein
VSIFLRRKIFVIPLLLVFPGGHRILGCTSYIRDYAADAGYRGKKIVEERIENRIKKNIKSCGGLLKINLTSGYFKLSWEFPRGDFP